MGLLKDTHDLRLKFHEFEGKHGAARMEDEIEAFREQLNVAAESLAETALDAIALVGLTEDFAGGEADPRRGGTCVTSIAGMRLPRGKKPAHGRRLALASG